MAIDWLLLTEKGLCAGIAGIGFGILFNVPVRAILPIGIMGALAGFVKFTLMSDLFHLNIIIATLFGTILVGMLSIVSAHIRHAPPPIFAIPAVIPLVPGILAYKVMLGLISLADKPDPATYTTIMAETVNNGLKVMFILMSLAGGVGFPLLITRKESAKEIRLIKRRG